MSSYLYKGVSEIYWQFVPNVVKAKNGNWNLNSILFNKTTVKVWSFYVSVSISKTTETLEEQLFLENQYSLKTTWRTEHIFIIPTMCILLAQLLVIYDTRLMWDAVRAPINGLKSRAFHGACRVNLTSQWHTFTAGQIILVTSNTLCRQCRLYGAPKQMGSRLCI